MNLLEIHIYAYEKITNTILGNSDWLFAILICDNWLERAPLQSSINSMTFTKQHFMNMFYEKQRKGDQRCFGKMKIGRSLKNNIRNLPRKSTLTILSPLHFNPWKFFTITTSAILDSSIRNVNNNVKVVCNKRTRKQTR